MTRLKIIVGFSFMQNNHPAGSDLGMTYAHGLQRLGHEVYLIDDMESHLCADDRGNPVRFEEWEGRRRFECLTKSYGIWESSCLIYDHGKDTHGMPLQDIVNTARTSDLLLLVGSRVKVAEILEGARCKAYVDINPAKTQVYHDEYGVDYGLKHYDYFFTTGLSIGTPKCPIPTCGVTWHGLVPPVDLETWPAAIDGRCRRFTTISTWRGRRSFNFQGCWSGDKAENWLQFVQLPRKTSQELEIALKMSKGSAEDRRLLEENGWILSDPERFQGVQDYRAFIANSRAEFSAANNRVVQFNTGWLSDRTMRYLASGKPALVQSTGIEQHLPTGKGLLTFQTMEEAITGIDAINRDYRDHCLAARHIAEEYCDSAKVLTEMLRQMGLLDRVIPTGHGRDGHDTNRLARG